MDYGAVHFDGMGRRWELFPSMLLTASAKLVIPAAKDDMLNAQLAQRAGAHDTGFHCHEEPAVSDVFHGSAIDQEHLVNRHKLGVSGAIAGGHRFVVPTANHTMDWVVKDAADRHLVRI